MTQERKAILFEEMLDWICESIENEEDLYLTLHEHISMTLEELHEYEIRHLDSYFTEYDPKTQLDWKDAEQSCEVEPESSDSWTPDCSM